MSDKIKMSDVFELPVTGLMGDDLKMDCDIEKAEFYTIAAINAYDANQELIERYQKLVCQTCDGHGAVGNILDSMDCPDCTLYVGPSEEIAKQQTEINELKAQNLKMLIELSNISQACIGELAMGYKIDAQGIGQGIFESTGMTSEQLIEATRG